MAIVDRASTPQIGLREAFTPQAAVTDSYVRPASPAKSPLWDLAEGLQDFSSSLRGVMDRRKAEDAKKNAALGEAQFYKDNSVGYAEAVRTGKLPSFESPEFVAGYKQAEGANLGRRMVSKFELEYSTWDGRNGQDPAAFDAFVGDFISRNLTSDDPYILAGAMPYVGQITDRGYSLNTQERADSLYNNSITSHIAGSDDDIDWAIQSGTASGQGTDKATLWDALMANRDKALSTGIRAEDYDSKLIDLVISKAGETGDEDLLSLLDNKVPGKEYSYSNTPYGREKRLSAAESIEVAKRQAEERQHTAQTRADAAMKDQMEAFVVEKLAADPNHVFDEDFLNEYQKYDPQARLHVRDWSRKLAEGVPEDRDDVLQLYDRILKGEDPSAVIRLGMDSGIIRTAETLKGLSSFKGPQSDVNRFTQNPVYKTSLGALRQAATPQDAFTFYNPEAASPAAVAIQLDYEKAMTHFIAQNPKATDLEISEEAARVYGILQKGISASGDYTTPTAARIDANPLVPSQAQSEQEAADKATFEASPQGQADVWANPQPPKLGDLPQDQRRQLEEAASAMGIDPQIFADRTWQKVQQMLQQQNTEDAIGQGIDAILEGRTPTQGMVAPGNIDLDNRQVVHNDDGSISTEESMSFNEDGVEVLIPTVFDGAHHSDEEAIQHYHQTGEFLGKFDTPENADAYAEALHQRQERAYEQRLPQSKANPDIFNPTLPDEDGFLEPDSNPDVSDAVLDRFSGKKLPVSIRNNNMGAISITGSIARSWAAKQPGFVGVTKRPPSEGGYYAMYATPEHGVAAASRLLEQYGRKGVDTPAQIVRRWSTDKGAHDTYAATLVAYLQQAGFDVDAKTHLDLSNPAVRLAILKAKSAHESGAGIPVYAEAVFERGVNYVLPDEEEPLQVASN